jgi:hypothetical protein
MSMQPTSAMRIIAKAAGPEKFSRLPGGGRRSFSVGIVGRVVSILFSAKFLPWFQESRGYMYDAAYDVEAFRGPASNSC